MELFKKIADPEHKILFPKGVDSGAKSLIKHLLTRNVRHRYGCMRNGVDDIKSHRFFEGVDWDAVRSRSLSQVPFIPQIKGPGDSRNFISYEG